MAIPRFCWPLLPVGTQRHAARPPRRPLFRRAGFEALEARRLLAVAPQLEGLDDVTVAAGAPLQVALRAIDTDPDEELTYTATVENLSLTGGELSADIPDGNQSMRINVLDFGSMTFELFEQRVPDATEHILDLVEDGKFVGEEFYRIAWSDTDGDEIDATPFVLQTGPSESAGLDDEFHPDLRHTSKGVLSMANRTADAGRDTNSGHIFVTAGSPRYLDFKHSVFGFLTDGEQVREAIQNVPQGPTPDQAVVIDSVDVFVDPKNGVMTLSAPEGASGRAEVTVTVTDSQDNIDQETFFVDVVPDTWNDYAYLLPIADLHAEPGQPVEFEIPAADVEGDTLRYGAIAVDTKEDVDVSVDPETGMVTVTPAENAAGVYAIKVGVIDQVANRTNADWDTQEVPLFIDPPAPTAVALLASTDTGPDDGDGLTSINNDGDPLRFRVSGVVSGATVTVLADGTSIGQGTASGGVVAITTNGTTKLDDGPHTITAVQTLVNWDVNMGNRQETVDLGSDASPALEIEVDTAAPQFTSQPTLGAAVGVRYVYDAQTDDEDADQPVRYSLKQSPAGMTVGLETGRLTWTPQAGQGPARDVILVAEDAAGNRTELPFTLEINQLPVLDPIGGREVDEHALLTFTAAATDDGGDVTFGLGDGAPAGAEIDPHTGVFEWTPTEAQGPGEYTFAVEAVDDTGLTASETITVTVNEVNVPPGFPADELNWTLDEGDLWQWQPEVQDPDLPANDLMFALEGDVPDDLIFDPDTGEILWQPGEQAGGTAWSWRLSVTDESGQGDEQTLAVAVNEVDQAPAVAPVPRQFVLPGGSVSVRVEAADPDTPGNAVRFALEGDVPEGLALDETTGQIDWDVPDDFLPGQVTVHVRVIEQTPAGDGLASEAQVDIQVLDLAAFLFDAAFGQDGFSTAILPERPSNPIASPLTQAPADESSGAPAGGTRALLPRLSLEDTGMFGSQIGPFTPSGTTGKPLQNTADEQTQDDEEESGESDRGDENPRVRATGQEQRARDVVWKGYDEAGLTTLETHELLGPSDSPFRHGTLVMGWSPDRATLPA